MSEAAALELHDLHVVFGVPRHRPVHALRGFDLTLPRGAVLGLLGPNGSGKTTAIACAVGLLRPHQGRVRIDGVDVTDAVRADPRPRHGVVLEDTRLPPFVSVRRALELTARLRGFRGAAAHREVERVVEICRAAELTRRGVATLSKGQARRIGLAAALIGDPPLLILDEPSAGLDATARVEFDALVRTLRDGRRTVLIASHLLGDVESTCSHVAFVRDGQVLLTGRTEDLVAPDAVRRAEIFVDRGEQPALEGLGLSYAPSRYPDQLRIDDGRSDLEILEQLVRGGIVPRRMEPRRSLLSLYLELVGEGST